MRDSSIIPSSSAICSFERQIGYLPDTAVAMMKARHQKAKVRFQSVRAETITEVKQRLEQHHSPEQLAGRMKREGVGKISYETIYLMIYANYQEMGIYQQYLRQKLTLILRGARKSSRRISPG